MELNTLMTKLHLIVNSMSIFKIKTSDCEVTTTRYFE